MRGEVVAQLAALANPRAHRGGQFALSPTGSCCYGCAMQVRETADSGLPVIHLAGEVDLQESPQLRTVLQRYVDARTPALALDFSDVEYIDSSGLATIVEYVRGAQAYAGKLALAGLSARVKTIFDIVRLGEIMPIFGSLAEARAMLLAPPA